MTRPDAHSDAPLERANHTAVQREVRTLPGGVTLLMEVDPAAPSAAAAWLAPVGSRDEPDQRAGASHLLEHMAFKGPAELNAGELDRRLDALGADVNAFTGEDRTAYHGTVLPEHLGALNEALAAMLRPALRPEDLEVERAVVLEEIAMTHDQPDDRALETAAARYFAGHPLGRPVLGTRASVAGLTRDALDAWRARHYAPARLVVALAGRFDPDAEADRVARLAEALAADGSTPEPRVAPTPHAGRSQEGDPSVTRAYGAMLAPGVAADEEARIAAALLARVLGEPGHGALHWALVDPGLAEQAGLDHEPGAGFGTWTGWYAAAPDRAAEARARFEATLLEAQDAPLDPAAWHRARRTLATDIALRAESSLGRALALADAWLDRRALHDPRALLARVHATEPEEGEALLARRPFDAMHLHVLGPAGD
ncbi:MAG: pitrilysin family protein [Trueperaceae bacterium]|nr:pitrilysin family protein [Trueperaceae bacterium]